MNTYTINLKCDLDKIKNCVIQCKMNFNRDPSKQAQEVIFSGNHKRQTIIKFISIATSFNKFPLKKIFERILILN